MSLFITESSFFSDSVESVDLFLLWFSLTSSLDFPVVASWSDLDCELVISVLSTGVRMSGMGFVFS